MATPNPVISDSVLHSSVSATAAAVGGVPMEDTSSSSNVSDSVKVLAEKHAVIRSHLDEKLVELAMKKEKIKMMSEVTQLQYTKNYMAEQQLHKLNQVFFEDTQTLAQLEDRHHNLVQESVELQWKIDQLQQKLDNLEKRSKENFVLMEEFKAKVKSTEEDGEGIDRNEAEEREKIQQEIDALSNLKERLEADEADAEIQQIRSGSSLQIVEAQKLAILEAQTDQESELKALGKLLEEKEQEIQKMKQSSQIQEKQNRARVLKMQRQLADLEETERHLQNTVTYLEGQIDFGTK